MRTCKKQAQEGCRFCSFHWVNSCETSKCQRHSGNFKSCAWKRVEEESMRANLDYIEFGHQYGYRYFDLKLPASQFDGVIPTADAVNPSVSAPLHTVSHSQHHNVAPVTVNSIGDIPLCPNCGRTCWMWFPCVESREYRNMYLRFKSM